MVFNPGRPHERENKVRFRPSKDHSTKRKRSRIRLQLVLRENWCWKPAALWCSFSVPHDLCLRTAFHEETVLLTVLQFRFRVRSPYGTRSISVPLIPLPAHSPEKRMTDGNFGQISEACRTCGGVEKWNSKVPS